MNKLNRELILIGLYPFYLFCLLFLIRFINNDVYFFLTKPEGYFEYLQFFFYLSAGIILLISGYKQRIKHGRIVSTLLVLLGLACILVAGEEVSWGQTIFGFKSPHEFTENNVQGELNFHNLSMFQDRPLHTLYAMVGLIGTLLILFKKQISSILEDHISLKDVFDFFAPRTELIFYFLSLAVYYFTLEYYIIPYNIENSTILDFPSQEIFELLLSLSLLLYSSEKHSS